MSPIAQMLCANGAKPVDLRFFPALGREHSNKSRRQQCCTGSGHLMSRRDAAEEWADERGLKILELPSGEVLAV